ncbi:PAS domain S-box protein [Marinomonas epiphytica]
MNWLQSYFVFDTSDQHVMLGTYDTILVCVSIFLAITASFFALRFASVAKHIVLRSHKNIALISGACVMAGGIWSMHFVGMLAYDMGHAVVYDPFLTLVSIAPCILAAYIALRILILPKVTPLLIILGGTSVGAGIGSMHYIGMAAMEMGVILRYDPLWFGFSIVIAVVLAILALSVRHYILEKHPDLNINITNTISALIMGTAISAMHYAGMTGARFIMDMSHQMAEVEQGVDTKFLSLAVSIITLLVSILATNITSQLRYRQLLIEKTSDELRLKTTLDTAIDGIITIDHTGCIRAFNKAAETIFGWQEAEVMGKNVSMLMPQPYQKEHDSYLSNFHRTGNKKIIGSDQEVTAIDKKGKVFPIRLGVGHVELEGMKPLFVGFVTDITARKEMERKIRESEEQYSSLIKNIPGASFRCQASEKWKVIFISEAVEELSGWKVQDFYQGTITPNQLIHLEDQERTQNTIQQAIENKSVYTVEYRLKHKHGHYIWVLENGSLVKDDDGESWVDGVILDISSRVEMEEDLRKAKVKAEASAESKSAFLANMSHEIRTPMNAIIGFSDILLESNLTDDNKRHISTISKSARSLLHLLNDILDSAKLDKNKLELDEHVFSIHDTVDSAISTLWLQAKSKNLDLSFNIANDIAKAYYGAGDRIRQVLMNLLGNAIKFTEQGKVTLDITRTHDQLIQFTVQDTGIGIEQERLDSIFDPFTQADASMSRRFGGTGLGTTISKQLVDLMGGTISAHSTIGKGSTFSFSIPLEESQLPSKKATKTIAKLSPKTVLVADDVEQNITLLEIILKRHNHTVFKASNGLEAIETFLSVKPDIILMDIQMPKMDGLSASREIRKIEEQQKLKPTPIIALTANVLLEDKLEAQDAGMDGFANKPIDVSALTEEMARVLNTELILEELSIDSTETVEKSRKQIHLNKALTLWGELPIYLTELNRFYELNHQFSAKLQAGIDNQAFDEVRQAAHAVKGSSSNLALLEVSQRALEIEESAKALDGIACINALQLFTQEFNDFSEELAELKKTHPMATEDDSGTLISTMSEQDVLNLVQDIIRLTHSGEIDDNKLELLVQVLPAEHKPLGIEASNAIADFEFDDAISHLEQLNSILESN